MGEREREDNRKGERVKGRVEGRKDRRFEGWKEGILFSSSSLFKCLWLETHPAAKLAIKSNLISKYNWALNLQINGTIMAIS